MSRDPATLVADEEPHVQAEVQRAAIRQLLAGGPFAESLHIVLVIVVAALVWNFLPLSVTAGWVAAVTAAALLRTGWRLRVRRRSVDPEEALRVIRLTVTGIGLAWGVGAAMAFPDLRPREGALILVVLTGIIAGATSTLVGDRRSFRYLLITTLAPLPIAILLQGQSRFNVIATILIVLFAFGMDRVHSRGYRTFVERVRGGVLLELSSQELARQHAYLDALIASTPVAIAVLDDQRVVRSVNPAFEVLFGYAAAEVVGAGIDRLIVPEALQSESSDLETRVRRGEVVRVELERMRKDGRRIQVRLSAAAVKAAADGALVALYEDISDRKAAEAAMREARDLAERVARARSAIRPAIFQCTSVRAIVDPFPRSTLQSKRCLLESESLNSGPESQVKPLLFICALGKDAKDENGTLNDQSADRPRHAAILRAQRHHHTTSARREWLSRLS